MKIPWKPRNNKCKYWGRDS